MHDGISAPGRTAGHAGPPPVAETALLWAIRTWVAGRRRDIPAERDITAVFAKLGAPDAPGYLFGLLWLLDNGARRHLATFAPRHPGISPDEQVVLDILALSQERQCFERLLLLRTLLRPEAATPASQSASGLVEELNGAGLFLQPRFESVRHHAVR